MIVVIKEVQRAIRPRKHELQVHGFQFLCGRQEICLCDMEGDVVACACPLNTGFGEEEPGTSKVDERLIVSIGVYATDSPGLKQRFEEERCARGVGYDEGYVTD